MKFSLKKMFPIMFLLLTFLILGSGIISENTKTKEANGQLFLDSTMMTLNVDSLYQEKNKQLDSVINIKDSLIEASEQEQYEEHGIASWYGPGFQGNKTANGEIFDTNDLTAAHKTLPFNTICRVINLSNDEYVDIRINDRGPYVKGRIIDLSKEAKTQIKMGGTTKVKLIVLKWPPNYKKKK
jgi:rare lipoprotein A